MKRIFFILAFGLNISVFAQLKPIYFVGSTVVQDSTKATSYGIYGKLSGEDLYVLKIYDLDDNLTTTGSYKDQDLKIAHGAFVYYADVNIFNRMNHTSFTLKGKTRYITGKGNFVDGDQHGRWISFFPDGKIMSVTTYVKGIRHGFYGKYDRRGKMLVSGNYKLDEKDGEWQYREGRDKEFFINGIKQVAPEKSSKNKSN